MTIEKSGIIALAKKQFENNREKENSNLELMRNRLMYEIGGNVSNILKSRGFSVRSISSYNWLDNLSAKNRAGDIMASRVQLLENSAYREKIKRIIQERKKQEGLWTTKEDGGVFVEKVDGNHAAIISRAPKYSSKENQANINFDIFVTILDISNSSFPDQESADQQVYEVASLLRDELQQTIDYNKHKDSSKERAWKVAETTIGA